MKKFTLLLVIATLLLFACGKTENKTEVTEDQPAEVQKAVSMTFTVHGIGEMSKKLIEEAAFTVKGVSDANWDMDSKNIKVNGNGDVVWEDVHTAISTAGFDTTEMKASDEAYNALPLEAQYRVIKEEKAEPVVTEKENTDTNRTKAKRVKVGE